MALSLLCGGLGVAEATVHVNEGTGVTHEVYTTGETYSREVADAKLDLKADKTDVATNTANINNLDGKLSNLTTTVNGKADAAAVTTALDSKADTDLSNLTAAGETKIKNTMSADMDLKANKADVNIALDGKADKATVTDLATKVGDASSGLVKDVATLKTTVGDASSGLVKDVADLKTQGNDLNTAIGNKADQSDLDAAKAKITTNETNITALQTKTTGLSADGKSLNSMNRVETDALKVTGEISNGAGVTTTLAKIDESMKQTETNKGDIADLKSKTDTQQTWIGRLKDRTTQISYDTAKGTTVNGVEFKDAEVDANGKGLTGVSTLNTTGAATIGGALKADSLIVENASNLKGDVTMDNKLSVTGDTTLGALNVTGESSLKDTQVNGTLTTTGKATFKEAVEMDKGLTVTSGDTTLQNTDVKGALNVTGESNLKNTTVGGTLGVTGEATFKDKVTMEKDLEVKGELKTDKIAMENKKTDADGRHNSSTAITADYITHIGEVENSGVITKSSFTHNEKGTINYAKDGDTADWKETRSYVTASGVSNKMTDSDKNKHTYSQTATESKEQLVNGDKSKSNFEKKTAEGNTISITEKDAAGNVVQSLTNKQTVKGEKTSVTNEDSSSIIKQEADQIRHNVTSADGKKSSIEVKAEGITNKSKDGTITNDAKNIVNNASGDMTNTVGGKLTTTVTGATEENYNGGLTTNVTGEENHTVTGKQNNKVTGKQTNTVEGGQINNITGDQTTTITGTKTETVTENVTEDYQKNLTTTVGGNEIHDVKGTKTETVEGKVTENFKGGQETNVTGNQDIHVTGKQTNKIDGNQENTIGGDQTTNVTGDILNTAKNITNTANEKLTDEVGDNTRVTTSTSITDSVGATTNRKIEDGKITDTAGDSTVTTENGKGTTFAKTDSAEYSTEAGAPKDTNIAGNLITTGRVDANELGVSDKDGANTADFSVKAGEGVKASAGDGTTTGSLDVKADEVGSSVKDASGKGSTFKQRIDAIMMESKDVSIKAEGTLTNEAKDIVTNASNSITEKVGETNVTTKTTTSSKSEIQNADTITSVQQTENMVQSYVGKKDDSATNVTTNFANASANMVTQDGQTSTVLNNKDGLLVRNTANGSSFIMADGTNTGAALEWTNVKGNEISTGKVEANYVKMDYADVMKDLGVHGNAKVDQNLEVGGTSTLKGDVTMESNATVKKDLKVEGTTTTQTLKVTENAEIDGTLKVAKKATFEDSVSIAKDLSVGGDVTANSYKVDGKTYIDANGIHANGQKITDVADGSISEGSKDAVNGGQLYGVKRDLEHQVDKVGANAAAMANLRPMEFDSSSKWNIAAAIGNYGSETAAALGAFYRPNDDVMVNLSTAFGTGENMVGGGVSVRLGKGGNKLSREENNALKDQVNDLTARMDALLSVLNPNMSKDFPDVPENHWAYEAVSRLAGNDIVQGYPDGEFHGERTMTRYEMAEIIYNALSRGAEAERELVEEFKPELQAMAASEKATAEKAEG